MGPVQSDSPVFEIFYEPTKEQIKNFQDYFGWNYVTQEELNRITREYDEKIKAEHAYKPLFV